MPYGGDWQNFQNWLDSPQGWIFYLVLLVMIGLIPILVDFLRLRQASNLNRFPALLLWFGLVPLPIVAVAGPFGYFDSGVLLVSASAFSLFAGVVIARLSHRTVRFSAVLFWVGLSLLPIILVAPFVTYWYFSSPSIFLILASTFSLFAGVAILRWTQKSERLSAFLIWIGLGLSPIILFVPFVPWMYFSSVGGTCIFASAVPLFGGLILLTAPKARVAAAFQDDSNDESDET